jgi:hypothetical protein
MFRCRMCSNEFKTADVLCKGDGDVRHVPQYPVWSDLPVTEEEDEAFEQMGKTA